MGKRIVWDELLPSDDSQTDPREVQNIWKAITDALQVSFEFPTSGLAKGGAAKFHTAAAGTTGWTAEHAAQYTVTRPICMCGTQSLVEAAPVASRILLAPNAL